MFVVLCFDRLFLVHILSWFVVCLSFAAKGCYPSRVCSLLHTTCVCAHVVFFHFFLGSMRDALLVDDGLNDDRLGSHAPRGLWANLKKISFVGGGGG